MKRAVYALGLTSLLMSAGLRAEPCGQACAEARGPGRAVSAAWCVDDHVVEDKDARVLIEKLGAEFEALARKSRHRAELRKAAELLESTNQSSRWTNYKRAIEVLRQTRSKAGVPLMMKYMIRHASFGSSKANEYVEAITLITGYDLGEVDDQGSGREERVFKWVDDKYRQWWLPNKDKLETRLGKMEPERVEVVLNAVIKKVDWHRGYSRDLRDEVTAYRLYHLLHYKTMKRTRSSSDRRPWYDGELDKAMVPLLLEKADYRAKGLAEGEDPTVQRVPFAVVDLLAAMRRDNLAPGLDNIAEDPKQNAVTRLTCVLAMYAAGETLDTNALMSVLKTENRFEPRLVAILALQHSSDTKTVVPALLELLDDRNVEVCSAAVYALRGPKPPEAVEKLGLLMNDPGSGHALLAILGLLGEIGTEEATQALADYLAEALKDNSKDRYLSHALRSFQDATGKRWIEAGAHDKDYYRQKAREALDWWNRPRDD